VRATVAAARSWVILCECPTAYYLQRRALSMRFVS
jgi:hypothetical protein